ncbi:hypothetical protein JI739_06575 [Ramlibacter sp. AW1]|uniref:DUF883 domain-containing protein n=1 Tax=Ramlibacter aurantiacus TaxID=2801330 RepID=A0A937D5K5_9BURK|nr:hypothetical protein [Ramlibacter aurantiacus]MBL0420008.1 hypothetical protein [Ramlibacter aurantiacus]
MNSETSQNPFPTSSSMGSSGTAGSAGGSAMGGSSSAQMGGTASGDSSEGTVRRMAQRAHEAVDRLEQTLGSGSERVMGMQQEYGDYAREQVRDNPLAALGVAFLAGVIFGKLFTH